MLSLQNFKFDGAVENKTTLKNFGLTGMDNGRILFDKDNITEEEFKNLLKKECIYPPYPKTNQNKNLVLFPVNGNNKIYSYPVSKYFNCEKLFLKLNGGFYQGIFRIGDGCDYSVLPSNIGDGLSLEFELYRKDFESEGYTLNDGNNGINKGIFFYIGTRAENKWATYYANTCPENKPVTEATDLETSDGVRIDEYVPKLTESDNKFLLYSRTCGGTTVLNDKELGDEYKVVLSSNENILFEADNVYIDESYFIKNGVSPEFKPLETYKTVLVETNPVEYEENLFTVFSRKCGGITVNNFKEEYLEKHPVNKYNIYADLWNNALAFRITDDNRVGYKYLVKDCDAESPSCSYKIDSEYSNPDTVPYSEWTTIHVRILPAGIDRMRLLFYVDGRLVLFSKELPKLNLRELKDLPEKQEGVPFNISLGGGTQGLCDVVYEDYKNFHETGYPLQKEFAGSFIGYLKAFRFYSCSLNYSQIQQNVSVNQTTCGELKIYCGALVFNTKPSKTPISEQAALIPMLNEYPDVTEKMTIRLLPDLSKKYIRLVVAVPSYLEKTLSKAVDGMNGVSDSAISGQEVSILDMFRVEKVNIEETEYDVWYYTYATRPQYNNTIEIELDEIQ